MIKISPNCIIKLTRCTALGSLLFAIHGPVTAKVDFNRDIRPILSENCYTCHGPDEEARKGGSKKTGRLRLDTQDGSRMDLGDYAAVVPGKPEESELIYLITTEDEDDRMPPKKEGEPLDESKIALLKQWIEEGGKYDVHWAYKKPERPKVPKVKAKGLKNTIDHFIAKQLVSENLALSAEADRNALARRAAFDLTGLPPTPEEVEAFLADKKNGAYERYVERLLEKPAYGEHWARMWLDLARYADSAGYADDPLRTIWAFRDYVIRSFNENKPFDQFTIEQIAGDLLPNPGVDQLVATAFHRNTKTNSEGGTDDEEFRNEAVVDRVNTTMAVWMGTTIDCAQCHTHKYDPITQTEYFNMFAIFNNTADEDRKDERPLLPIYTNTQIEEREELQAELVTLKQELRNKLRNQNQHKHRGEWEKALTKGGSWQTLRPSPTEMKASSKAPLTIDEQGIIEVTDNPAPQEHLTITTAAPEGQGQITGIKLEVQAHEKVWVLNEFEVRLVEFGQEETESEGEEEESEETEEAETKKKRVPRLKFTNPTASFEQEWYVAKDLLDGNSSDRFTGWAVDGNLNAVNEAVFELETPLTIPEDAKLEFIFRQNFPNKKLKRFRLFVSYEDAPMPAIPQELESALRTQAKQRTAEEEAQLFEFFAQHDPGSKAELKKIASIEKALEAIKPETEVPVMREVAKGHQRQTFLQYRGSYTDIGPEVSPGIPGAFHALAGEQKPNRLSLAYWLTDKNNPLTARVVANRYWEAIFGIGLVATSEDFGSQGEVPSHPELLDWLAVELIESGWDIKHLLNLMVSSATYRQTSKVTPEHYVRDPDNRLLARGPRFRLSAEMIRDQALAVSGLLSPTMFGPSVRPLQPEMGLTAAFGGKTDWKTSEGEDKHRRGIYTTWRRSNPYPSMTAFDAPNREICTIRRANTNTPLQALVTLNDPVYIEAAQGLGRRMAAFDGGVEAKIAHGFQLSLVRAPSSKETAALVKLFHATKQHYSNNQENAVIMATDPIGDLPDHADAAAFAAWTLVGNALLNLDEMFLKR